MPCLRLAQTESLETNLTEPIACEDNLRCRRGQKGQGRGGRRRGRRGQGRGKRRTGGSAGQTRGAARQARLTLRSSPARGRWLALARRRGRKGKPPFRILPLRHLRRHLPLAGEDCNRAVFAAGSESRTFPDSHPAKTEPTLPPSREGRGRGWVGFRIFHREWLKPADPPRPLPFRKGRMRGNAYPSIQIRLRQQECPSSHPPPSLPPPA